VNNGLNFELLLSQSFQVASKNLEGVYNLFMPGFFFGDWKPLITIHFHWMEKSTLVYFGGLVYRRKKITPYKWHESSS